MQGNERWEQRAEVVLDRSRVFVELPPGDADRPPARHLKAAIACPVTLEGGVGGVDGAAVELEREPLGAPEAVDLDPLCRRSAAMR